MRAKSGVFEGLLQVLEAFDGPCQESTPCSTRATVIKTHRQCLATRGLIEAEADSNWCLRPRRWAGGRTIPVYWHELGNSIFGGFRNHANGAERVHCVSCIVLAAKHDQVSYQQLQLMSGSPMHRQHVSPYCMLAQLIQNLQLVTWPGWSFCPDSSTWNDLCCLTKASSSPAKVKAWVSGLPGGCWQLSLRADVRCSFLNLSLPKGEYATIPMPSSLQVGIRSFCSRHNKAWAQLRCTSAL